MIFNGAGTPPMDKVLLERFFSGTRNGVFIESGAYDGVFESICKVLEDEMGWTGFNVEPNPTMFARLVKNRPKCVNINLALSDKAGKATFRQPFVPGHGLENTWGTLEVKKYDTGITHEVETTTFKDLVEKHGIAKVDLWVLDVEGHEQHAIAGMAGCPVRPKIICAEHGHCSSASLSTWLEPFGYKYDMSHYYDSFFLWKG